MDCYSPLARAESPAAVGGPCIPLGTKPVNGASPVSVFAAVMKPVLGTDPESGSSLPSDLG